eukprot:NODE_2819_length_465_cov_8.793269_g2224_i0.p1 GENE.NODE_2819_length_465_cov_8.793269_g2224_i0~~NODE_2819_length_465_cov_8.793269_g2224_i0.p1  ORF type:complete len:114 (+),score=17.90 NODE_2819_length_465_cov_8.793269_g2224_i0:50-391(+)
MAMMHFFVLSALVLHVLADCTKFNTCKVESKGCQEAANDLKNLEKACNCRKAEAWCLKRNECSESAEESKKTCEVYKGLPANKCDVNCDGSSMVLPSFGVGIVMLSTILVTLF